MNRQAGMTLVELVVAIAVTGIIVAFLGTAVYHIFNVSEYGNDEFSALHDLQNAAYWFNLDTPQAISATGGSQLVLTMADNSTVTYSLSGTNLRRTGTGPQQNIAYNITGVTFSVSGRLATMILVTRPAGRSSVSENGTYMAYLRPAGV